jgi:hypothetical protein
MPARLRKLVGLVAVLAFLAAYVVGVSILADHIPRHWVVQLAFYAVAGICWGVPLLPLIRWMNQGR